MSLSRQASLLGWGFPVFPPFLEAEGFVSVTLTWEQLAISALLTTVSPIMREEAYCMQPSFPELVLIGEEGILLPPYTNMSWSQTLKETIIWVFPQTPNFTLRPFSFPQHLPLPFPRPSSAPELLEP